MEHSSRQWPQRVMQGAGVPNDSSINRATVQTTSSNNNGDRNNKMTRPSKEQALNCPRCNSLNTKFCYYNNYSLSQPRYFCKTCRRYWTQGGSLRNVPVGGGSRKNKRSSSSTLPSPPPPLSSSSKNYMNKLFPPINYFPNQSPSLAAFHEAHNLNLSYRPQVPPSAPTTGNDSANADVVPRGLSLMMMGPNYIQDLPFSSGCGFPSHLLDFKPSTTSSSSTLDFSLAHINHGNSGNNYGGVDVDGYGSLIQLGLQEGGGGEARVLFPIKDPKQAMSSNTTGYHQQFEQNKELLRQGAGADSSSTGFWNHDMLLGRSTSGIHSSHQIQ